MKVINSTFNLPLIIHQNYAGLSVAVDSEKDWRNYGQIVQQSSTSKMLSYSKFQNSYFQVSYNKIVIHILSI